MSLDRLRADHVGSLLRPQALIAAMRGSQAGNVSAEQLGRIQDEAIRDAIVAQEGIGLPVVTDGEFRRHNFQESFGVVTGAETLWSDRRQAPPAPLTGTASREGARAPDTVQYSVRAEAPVTAPLALARSQPLREFTSAQAMATAPVKASLLSVDRIYQRLDIEGSRSVYPSSDELMQAVVDVCRQIVQGLVDAGCRYVQIDAPNYTRFVDPDSLETIGEEGVSLEAAVDRAIAWDNAVIDGFDGVTFGLHICRGNRQSMWHRVGHYDSIAERVFGGLRHQRLLLEYDTPRAGTFEPLRFVPKDKVAVLGLLTTKAGTVESTDLLRRRIDEASEHLPLDQLALSTQCGFGSVIEGNVLTADDQWRKLEQVVTVADEVWG